MCTLWSTSTTTASQLRSVISWHVDSRSNTYFNLFASIFWFHSVGTFQLSNLLLVNVLSNFKYLCHLKSSKCLKPFPLDPKPIPCQLINSVNWIATRLTYYRFSLIIDNANGKLHNCKQKTKWWVYSTALMSEILNQNKKIFLKFIIQLHDHHFNCFLVWVSLWFQFVYFNVVYFDWTCTIFLRRPINVCIRLNAESIYLL